jgi:hypothetical protein
LPLGLNHGLEAGFFWDLLFGLAVFFMCLNAGLVVWVILNRKIAMRG